MSRIENTTITGAAGTAGTAAGGAGGVASPGVPNQRSRKAVSLPPAGPAWYSSVMGTGILAVLLGREAQDRPTLLAAAAALLTLGVVVLVGLSALFIRRVYLDRSAFTATVRDATVLPTWGTVSMGVLAIGSAVLTVVPQLGGAGLTAMAVRIDASLWTLGTVLGVVTAFGFAAVLVKRDVGHPVPAWGLPIVPPMVSATTGAALVPYAGTPAAHLSLLTVAIGCFFLSLFLGGLVFALSYHHHWKVAPLPIAASASTWIPLGVVGQSTAAAQAMATQLSGLLTAPAATAVHDLANAYGYVMLAVSVPVIAFAVRVTVRGFRARMSFTPGWWALTFPIGTLALGCQLLGQATDDAAISVAGTAAIIVLAGTWTLCATATLRALRGAAWAGQDDTGTAAAA